MELVKLLKSLSKFISAFLLPNSKRMALMNGFNIVQIIKCNRKQNSNQLKSFSHYILMTTNYRQLGKLCERFEIKGIRKIITIKHCDTDTRPKITMQRKPT